jgi:dephospho-CoA kinase
LKLSSFEFCFKLFYKKVKVTAHFERKSVLKMYILGLTGPSGAGKSLAARYLAKHGFVHVDADKSARFVVLPGTPCLKKLAEVFGSDILLTDGSLDRKKLAELAFGNGRVDELNATTHPFIIEEINRELGELEESGTAFAVLDAPTLYESGADKLCNGVMAVTSSREARISRIMSRDGLNLEQVSARLDAQPDDNFYTDKADFVIKNSGLQEDLLEAIDKAADHITGCGGIIGV